MKTRTGFVSNSSSSSFVVPRYDIYNNKKLITRAQERKLRLMGFLICTGCDSLYCECNIPEHNIEPEYVLKRFIACNGHDILVNLLLMGVPLEADYDDGMDMIKWDGKGKINSKHGMLYPHEWVDGVIADSYLKNDVIPTVTGFKYEEYIEELKKKYASEDV